MQDATPQSVHFGVSIFECEQEFYPLVNMQPPDAYIKAAAGLLVCRHDLHCSVVPTVVGWGAVMDIYDAGDSGRRGR